MFDDDARSARRPCRIEVDFIPRWTIVHHVIILIVTARPRQHSRFEEMIAGAAPNDLGTHRKRGPIRPNPPVHLRLKTHGSVPGSAKWAVLLDHEPSNLIFS